MSLISPGEVHDVRGLSPEAHGQNEWRLLAGRGDSGAPLTLRSSTWIYDVRLTADSPSRLPDLPEGGLSCLLYVFEGTASVGDVVLEKGDSLLIEDEPDGEIRSGGADLVLFVTDTQSPHYDGGMFSGNQYPGTRPGRRVAAGDGSIS